MVEVTLVGEEGKHATVDKLGRLDTVVQDRLPPPTGSVARFRYYTAALTSAGGLINMNATVGDSGTDGVAADHTGPEFVFTSAAGGLTGAVQITVIDTGDSGNAILDTYDVSVQTDDNTVSLTRDPTNGSDEVGIDWAVPSTAVFSTGQNEDYMIHVMGIQILIADTAIVHSSFGNVSALSTGWDLIVSEGGEDTFLIQKAQTGGQVIAQAGAARPFGDGTKSFELESWNGTQDAQLIWIPTEEYVPDGVRFAQGSSTTIRSVVNDDLTGLTEMTVRVFGYKHFPS